MNYRRLIGVGVLVMGSAGAVNAQRQVYTNEADFLNDLSAMGLAVVTEGFEDRNTWGLLETASESDVTSLDVRWSSLGGAITLSHPGARSGDWELGTAVVGAPVAGITGVGVQTIRAFGGWVRTGGGLVHDIFLFLNGEPTNVLDNSVGPVHAFFGVIDTNDITQFQFSTEPVAPGDVGSPVFVDDFVFGFADMPSPREPGVAWINSQGGDYAVGGNWEGGVPPVGTSNALFHLASASPYTVNLSQNETAHQTVIGQDAVVLDSGGFQYNLASSNITRESLIVGEIPGDTADLTVTNAVIAAVNSVVAHSTETDARFNVAAGATLNLTGAMRVGSGGSGTLEITDGGSVSSAAGFIGQWAGSGMVNVDGPASQWQITQFGPLHIGMGGATGSLNISGGGLVSCSLINVSLIAGNNLPNEPSGIGAIHVTNPGSRLASNSLITLGVDAAASLSITDGGQMGSSGDMVCGVGDAASIVVDGAGSALLLEHPASIVESTLTVGQGDSLRAPDGSNVHTTALTIQNGGLVECEETFMGSNALSGVTNGDGVVNVTGPGSTWRSGTGFSDGWTYIGYRSNATVNVSHGGAVETGGVFISRFTSISAVDGSGTRGVVNVDGPGSSWTTVGATGFSTLYVGFPNDPQVFFHNLTQTEGQLHVTGGGTVTAYALVLAERKSAKGIVTIDGAGSTIEADNVHFGPFAGESIVTAWDSSARMSISDGGLLHVANDLDVFHGVVDLSDGSINASRVRLFGGNLLPPTDPNDIGDTNVTLSGDGMIIADVDNVGGILDPGHLVGRLTIDGHYTQQSDATLIVDLGGTTPGTQHDVLDCSSNAVLAGTLDVRLANGFVPSVGDRFDILTASVVTGSFDTVLLPALGDGVEMQLDRTDPTRVTLVITGTVAGDWDGDADVDFFDFAGFQICFTGADAGPIDVGCEPGDFDGDDDIDADDWAAFGLAFTGPGPLPESVPWPKVMPTAGR